MSSARGSRRTSNTRRRRPRKSAWPSRSHGRVSSRSIMRAQLQCAVAAVGRQLYELDGGQDRRKEVRLLLEGGRHQTPGEIFQCRRRTEKLCARISAGAERHQGRLRRCGAEQFRLGREQLPRPLQGQAEELVGPVDAALGGGRPSFEVWSWAFEVWSLARRRRISQVRPDRDEGILFALFLLPVRQTTSPHGRSWQT